MTRHDERYLPAMIALRFGSYESLASALHYLGLPVRCADSQRGRPGVLAVTPEALSRCKRLREATGMLACALAPRMRRHVLVVRGHPGGTGQQLAQQLCRFMEWRGMNVQLATGWIRDLFVDRRYAALAHQGRVVLAAQRAHCVSTALARSLLKQHVRVVLWDPLFSNLDALNLMYRSRQRMDVTIITPGVVTPLAEAIAAVADRAPSAGYFGGLPPMTASRLIHFLYGGPKDGSYDCSTLTAGAA